MWYNCQAVQLIINCEVLPEDFIIMDIVFGVILILAALALVVSVLLRSGKDKSLSSAIAGGSSDTYYGKNKAQSIDKKLDVITMVVAIVFAAIVLVSFIIQDDADIKKQSGLLTQTESESVTEPAQAVSTEADPAPADTTVDAGAESAEPAESVADTASAEE